MSENEVGPWVGMRVSGVVQWSENRRLVGLTLVLVVILVYLPGIVGGAFHFDDGHHITDNPALRDAGNLYWLRYFVDATLWSGERGNVMYRPMGMLPHALDYLTWRAATGDGFYASGWVLTNTLLHASVVLLVWRLALRLGLSSLASALAGLVTALHPIHSEVVNYVSARSESMAAIFVLLALHAHLRSRVAALSGRILWMMLAGLLSVCAITSKETAALFFLAVFWLEIVVTGRSWPARLRRGLLNGGVYFLVFGAVMLLRRYMLQSTVASLAYLTPREGADVQVGGGRTVLQNLLTQSRVVVAYYQQLVQPTGLSVDHDIAIVTTPTAAVVASCALHLTLAGAALRELWKGRRLVPLCAGWFWIFLAPSIVVPLNVVMNEHRLYLPGIAVSLLAGAALARVVTVLERRHGRTFAISAVALPFVLFMPLVIQRSQEWRDDLSLWTAAVRRSPRSARAHMHLGASLYVRHRTVPREERVAILDRALAEYLIADELHPRWYDLQLNLGGAWLDRARLTGNSEEFEKSLAAYVIAGEIVGLDKARPRLSRALVLTELERYDEAVAILEKLDEEDDAVTTIYDDALARALRRRGDMAGATAAMERVISLEEPQNKVSGLLTLGWWHFEDGDLGASQ